MTERLYPMGVNYEYPLNIGKLLATPMHYAPRQQILYRDQVVYDYSGFISRINRLASGLDQIGIKAGDTIAVLEYNSHRFLEFLFAIPMMGAALHTINWRQTPEHVGYTIEHSKADTVIVNSNFLPQLESITGHLGAVKRIIVINEEDSPAESGLDITTDYESLIASGFASFDFPDIDEKSIASIFYTAGTTGKPKGVFFSHRQIVLHTLSVGLAAAGFNPQAGFSSFDTYMPITPMYHEHGWGMPYLATLLGARQVFPGRHNSDSVLKLIASQKITFTHCVPTMLHMLLSDPASDDMDLSSLKLIVGGAKLHDNLARKATAKGIKIYSGYGMSEACPLISVSNLKPGNSDDSEQRLQAITSAGIPVPLMELKIVDPQGTFMPHDGHSAGEIILRAPWLTKGYYNDPNRAKNLWRDGWLYTGDIGYVDEEGYIHITDRIKNVIKSGGEWISSPHLEKLVRKHGAVADAAVIAMPDEKWGERPVVLVVIKDEFKEQTTIEDLQNFMHHFVDEGEITKYSLPDKFLIVDEIPRTGVRKINIRQIRQIYGQ